MYITKQEVRDKHSLIAIHVSDIVFLKAVSVTVFNKLLGALL